jgi:hypothetical protein
MTDEEIKEKADKLNGNSRESTAYFGIVEENQDFYIKANRDGLRLFAAELLYASINDNESKVWGINNEWYDSSALEIDHIQLIDAERISIESNQVKSKGVHILEITGCAVGIILAIFIVVGAIATFKAIIDWI